MTHGRFTIPISRILSATMGFLLFFSLLGAFAPKAQAVVGDGATSNIDLLDTNNNGKIDRITFDIANPNTETWTLDGAAPYGLSVTQGGTAITISAVALTTAATANPVTVRVDLDEADTDLEVDTDAVNSATEIELIYTQGTGDNTCTNCIDDATDEELNTIATGDTGVTDTETDAASAVISTFTPAENSFVANSANIVVTFSEPMDTTFAEGTEFTITPDPGTVAAAWTVGDTVVTLNPDPNFVPGTTYAVALDDAEIVDAGPAATLNVAGTNDGTWSFSIASGGGGGGGGEPTVYTYDMDVLTPNGGEDLSPGETYDITWQSGGTGTTNFVDILFSADGGSSYSLIADNEGNDGVYAWTVPDYATNEARVRVEGTDLADVLASDISDADFSIGGVAEAPEGEVPGEEDEGGETPGAGDFAPSPVTGELEEVSVVNPGDYIRGNSYSTVYYVDDEMIRHPFMDSQTFLTYEDSFDVVNFVSDATLPTLSLGVGMLPKPAVVLVKIESDPRVYAVTENLSDTFAPRLRHVETEEVAIDIYGDAWADYVIDIPPFTYAWYELGDPIDSVTDIDVDMSEMKTRTEVNP